MPTRSPWNHFSVEELRCNCGCGRWQMQDDFMRLVERMRLSAGFPFVVSSAFRCPEYNVEVSTTGPDGPHTTGKAMDILCYGEEASEIVRLAHYFGMTGIGVKQHGEHSERFIHIDNLTDEETDGPRPWIWSYR